MQTEELIGVLAANCSPVRPLPHPALRAVVWFAVSLAYVAIVVAAIGLRPDLPAKLVDLRFATQLGAAFLTSMMAAAAAFCSGCPGRPFWERLAPAPFLALWLGAIGKGCWSDWTASGAAGLAIHLDFICFPAILAISLLPGVLILAMIRRGAPISPVATMGLAALAAAALAAGTLQLFHVEGASVMALVWQFGSVLLLTALEALFGRVLLRWPTLEEALGGARRAAR